MNTDQFLFGKQTSLIPPFTTDRLLSVNKAAAALDCSPHTLYRWISRGYIPHFRHGSFVRVRVSDIYRHLFHPANARFYKANETEYSAWVAKRKPKSKAPTAPATPSESAK